ncbi:class I SAM-dependent methyltransferase [Jiangella asiatica]|uniref:Class I SAM-dependent methyltransferase n=1 Tax=Jiangella asiatica TaxID=2530372 RepID=A0A4R5CIB1_9ACTN|nr:class I SAM-dependent methyltransferase [Jiangella asiatica]TDD98290.1 class I SAM-dependent methyltransferase [Jiangella asiatica]
MIHQHPLAYLLGLEGVALLRAFAGQHDREFVQARLAEIRTLLAAADEFGDGGTAWPISTVDGYRAWAGGYDRPGNQLLDIEQPIVREILDGLPVGVALDVACGTGRHAAYLAELGHTVIGVDSSPEMLAVARSKVPGATFHEADLHRLPLPDSHVDTVVCALALTHVPELDPAFAEFARVLRPGGHLIVSDPRGRLGDVGLPIVMPGPDGRPGYFENRSRLASEYLAAALPLGLRVRRCEEPRRPDPFVDGDGVPPGAGGSPPPLATTGTPPNIWALHPFAPEAANAAYRGSPAAIIWHFELDGAG